MIIDKIITIRYSWKLTCLYLVNTCNIFLNVNVDTLIVITVSLLPFKPIKIWLCRIISTLLYLSSDWKLRIYKTKNSWNPHIAQSGKYELIAQPGFYGVGLPGRVISCQPWEESLFSLNLLSLINYKLWYYDNENWVISSGWCTRWLTTSKFFPGL